MTRVNDEERNSPPEVTPKTRRHVMLPDKKFVARNSLLTDLWEDPNIRTVGHICVVALLLAYFTVVTRDFAMTGRIDLRLRPLVTAFGQLHIACGLWLIMQALATLFYFGFRLWAFIGRRWTNGRAAWNAFGIVSFVAYELANICAFPRLVLHFDLGPASSVLVIMETIKFFFKTYAFVRANATKAELPSHQWFQYFFFCPTLVYRDAYPRTDAINWRRVIALSGQFLVGLLCLSLVFERFSEPYWGQFGASAIDLGSLIHLCALGCLVPGVSVTLGFHYLLLHVYNNLNAELTRFADRQFYTDWWTASSFSEYIRKWNLVVHGWLYTYIYKDLCAITGKQGLATIAAFAFSGALHEYIFSFAFRFFYPVALSSLLICILLGALVPRGRYGTAGNVTVWVKLFLGSGLLFALYTMEYYARKNCHVGQGIRGYLVPVSWSCNNVTVNSEWRISFSI